SFFFQAEDGIRDPLVTGVQTCALPICRHHEPPLRPGSGGSFRFWSMLLPVGHSPGSRSARNCVMSMTLYRYRSSPGFHLFSWCRSEEHTSELQSRVDLVCRLLLEKKTQ